MMQRWKLTIEYDGTDYCGWQRQEDFMSVQQALEEAFFKFCGEEVQIQGSGRTDTGVHALGQVAHVDIERVSRAKEIRNAVNYYLSEQGHKISIIEAVEVDDDFNARFSAKKRTYCYRILANRYPVPVLEEKYLWYMKYDLDVNLMHEAAQYLVGHHDFSSFRAIECQAKSPLKTLDKIEVKEATGNLSAGKYIEVWVESKSFLHHQVRNIVGTLRDVGMGKITPEEFKIILEKKDRGAAGMTAPASGLYFVKVEY